MSSNTPVQVSPQSVLVIDRSTKGLQKILGDVIKATADLATLSDRSQAIALEIESRSLELSSLETSYETARRTAEADLKLRVLEDAQAVLKELLSKFGLAEISKADEAILRKNIASLQAELAEGIAAAKAANRAELESAFRQASAAQESKHSLETAELKAQAQAKDSEIAFLKQQVDYLQKQIEAERTTRLEVAKADANKQGVIVNAGKQ